MTTNPQAQAFLEAAALMKGERYWTHDNVRQQIETLQALQDVVREVAYQLDKYKVLHPEPVRAFREAVPQPLGPSFQDNTAELLLLGSIENHVQSLYKALRDDEAGE
ncbi:hypothetical protein ACTXML_15985 [Glutamicibacter arilaitensis]|uniref:hypothetical protein n=1 Tax=Glutamicibacter arilaitensis TaxID=256701 RepID=UPI003FD44305